MLALLLAFRCGKAVGAMIVVGRWKRCTLSSTLPSVDNSSSIFFLESMSSIKEFVDEASLEAEEVEAVGPEGTVGLWMSFMR